MVLLGIMSRLRWIRQVPSLVSPKTLSAIRTRPMSSLKYTKTHEWIRPEDGTYTIGLSKFATDSIGDVVYVDLPDPGTKLKRGESFGNAESSKATSELFAPISGTVEKINEAVRDKPSLLNKSPENDGWLLKMKPDSSTISDDLMTGEEYREFLRRDER